MQDNEEIEDELNRIATQFSNRGLPGYMWEGVRKYLAHGHIPGEFLCAIFENKLLSAFAQADDINTAMMREWATLLYSDFPSLAIGSPGSFQQWVADGGLYGREEIRVAKATEESNKAGD